MLKEATGFEEVCITHISLDITNPAVVHKTHGRVEVVLHFLVIDAATPALVVGRAKTKSKRGIVAFQTGGI